MDLRLFIRASFNRQKFLAHSADGKHGIDEFGAQRIFTIYRSEKREDNYPADGRSRLAQEQGIGNTSKYSDLSTSALHTGIAACRMRLAIAQGAGSQ